MKTVQPVSICTSALLTLSGATVVLALHLGGCCSGTDPGPSADEHLGEPGEGPYEIRSVVVTGDPEEVHGLDGWKRFERSLLHRPLSDAEVESARRRLLQELQEAGYIFASVQVEGGSSLHLGTLELAVHLGTTGEVLGATPLPDPTLRAVDGRVDVTSTGAIEGLTVRADDIELDVSTLTGGTVVNLGSAFDARRDITGGSINAGGSVNLDSTLFGRVTGVEVAAFDEIRSEGPMDISVHAFTADTLWADITGGTFEVETLPDLNATGDITGSIVDAGVVDLTANNIIGVDVHVDDTAASIVGEISGLVLRGTTATATLTADQSIVGTGVEVTGAAVLTAMNNSIDAASVRGATVDVDANNGIFGGSATSSIGATDVLADAGNIEGVTVSSTTSATVRAEAAGMIDTSISGTTVDLDGDFINGGTVVAAAGDVITADSAAGSIAGLTVMAKANGILLASNADIDGASVRADDTVLLAHGSVLNSTVTVIGSDAAGDIDIVGVEVNSAGTATLSALSVTSATVEATTGTVNGATVTTGDVTGVTLRASDVTVLAENADLDVTGQISGTIFDATGDIVGGVIVAGDVIDAADDAIVTAVNIVDLDVNAIDGATLTATGDISGGTIDAATVEGTTATLDATDIVDVEVETSGVTTLTAAAELAARVEAENARIQDELLNRTDADEIWIIDRSGLAASDRGDAGDAPPPIRPDLVAEAPGGGGFVPVPLEHTAVRARVSGWLARAEVVQTFSNPFGSRIEAVYLFPLPEDAAVTDFLMTVGDRVIRGLIREREQAQRIYRRARSQGYVASLLTQERPNVFTQKVANIEPGKRIDITLTYFNTLRREGNDYVFTFPMVVGPRFNPPGHRDGIGAAPVGRGASSPQAVCVEYLAPGERSGHDISVEVEIEAGMPIHSVASTTHAVEVDRPGPGRAAVSLRPHDRIPNRDFELRYRLAGDRLQTAFLTQPDPGGAGGTFALLLEPPADLGDLPRVPREMVFVVDVSGSMQGRPLSKVKDALRSCLRALSPGDTFQIVRFSSESSELAPGPIPATPENVSRGLRYIEELRSGGGTMMVEGVKAALDMPAEAERLRVVSFMTDGYIGNEREIFREVARRRRAARIFSFGVGNSVNRHLVGGLARFGHGAAAYVGLDAPVGAAVDRFYEAIARPALTDIEVDWGGLEVSEVTPARVPDLFVGRPVLLTGRYLGDAPTDIRVTGRAGDGRRSYDLAVDPASAPEQHAGIRSLWARRKLAALARHETIEGARSRQRDMVGLSVGERVLCAYTAFLAVDSSEPTSGDHGQGVSLNVPVTVPDGVSYETTVR